MSNYPTSLDTISTLPEPTTGGSIPAVDDTNRSQAIKALESKLGVGDSDASSAAAGEVITADGSGSSSYEPIPSDTSKAPLVHTHDVDDLDTTGVAGASTFLRGDNQWATPAGGGGGDLLAVNDLSDVSSIATARTNLGAASASHTHPSSNITDFDSEVSSNSAVAANTTKVSYTDSAAVAANSSKVSYTDGPAVAANTSKVSFPEAPSDGNQYARKDAAWEQVAGGGSPALNDITDVDTVGGATGQVLTQQGDGSFALETPSAGGGGGGSNPYGANKVVAASGGDATSLGGLTFETGDIIYVEDDTTESVNIDTSAAISNLTIIVAPGKTLLFGTRRLNINGSANTLMIGGDYSFTSGFLKVYANESRVDRVTVLGTALPNGEHAYFGKSGGSPLQLSNFRYINSYTGSMSSKKNLRFQGDVHLTNFYLGVNTYMSSDGYTPVNLSYGSSLFSNGKIEVLKEHPSQTNRRLIDADAGTANVGFSNVQFVGRSGKDRAIYCDDANTKVLVSNCSFDGFHTDVYVNAGRVKVVNCELSLEDNGYGLYSLVAGGLMASNNEVTGSVTGTTGVYLSAAANDSIIIGNNLANAATPLSDASTSTVANNITT